jgi:hypothetical protein|eukprot:COSAG03_NODE_351_length_8724_cov_2.576348_7_plen_67_part_00
MKRKLIRPRYGIAGRLNSKSQLMLGTDSVDVLQTQAGPSIKFTKKSHPGEAIQQAVLYTIPSRSYN